MTKTDKELTTEIVNNFVTSWNQRERNSALLTSDVIDLIKSVHDALRNLPDTDKQDDQ